MAQDPMNDLVVGMERMGQMTFDELPDDVIMQIFDKLDILSRHKMRRVNKRMKEIQLKVKNNLEEIELNFLDRKLELIERRFEPVTILPRDDNELEHAMSRLVMNTHVRKIRAIVHEGISIQTDRVAVAFFNIEAAELDIGGDSFFHGRPQLDLPILFALAQKFRKLFLFRDSNTLRAQDLSLIRKAMLEGDCKLESFSIVVNQNSGSYLEDCLGITVRDLVEGIWRRIYRASDESVEMYTDPMHSVQCHVEGDIRTLMQLSYIRFERCKGGAKPDANYEKVKWNHEYEFNSD